MLQPSMVKQTKRERAPCENPVILCKYKKYYGFYVKSA